MLSCSACGGLDGGSADGGGFATGGGSGAACTDTWAGYGAAFFSNHCSNCHHHAGQFTTPVSVLNSTVKSYIRLGAMPQDYSLPGEEKARILAYLACGAP